MPIQLKSVQQSFVMLEAQMAEMERAVRETNLESMSWFNASDIFNSSSFHTQSEEIIDYIKELKQNVTRLRTVKDQTHADYLTQKITNQFQCLKNLFNSTNLSNKYRSQTRHQNRQQNSLKQRVQNLATNVTQNSQSLYEELSKLHEYERRLLDMVTEKQQLLNSSNAQNNNELRQQVLLTQQRLGRCRQAISGIEEKIQKLDTRD